MYFLSQQLTILFATRASSSDVRDDQSLTSPITLTFVPPVQILDIGIDDVKCVTSFNGTVPAGSSCHFPFTYKNQTFHNCTTMVDLHYCNQFFLVPFSLSLPPFSFHLPSPPFVFVLS